MVFDNKYGYYISDGSMEVVNDQSEDERSYTQVDAGARMVFLKNPDANPNSFLYLYTVREGTIPYDCHQYHTLVAGGPLVYEGTGILPSGTIMLHGRLYYYASNYWYNPEPIPVSGLVVYNYDPTFNETRRWRYALSILVPNLYDRESFLAGLAVGRTLWHQLIGNA